ncbi:hypothetical protein F5Y14DRAFT_414231 [Nemania sp. NC0429]|nr:hypothetical protein F5Y14DRAFT_414231 [Nemania sp. NC0429]
MPDFEFVHLSRPGDEKKNSTRIRRHVMKDIGKARRKPKKRAEVNKARPGSEIAARPAAEIQAQCTQALLPSPLEGCMVSDYVFPIEMDAERRGLTQYLFAVARSSGLAFGARWLSIGQTDAAAWYITLANAVLYRKLNQGFRFPKPEFKSDPEAMKWYTLSLRSVSKRLADPKESRREGLVTAIAGFICHDTSTANFTRQAIHMQGMKSIVEDLGGIDELSDPMLRLMISWHDLSGAAYRNGAPYFGVPKGSITSTDTNCHSVYLDTLLDSWDERCPCLSDIRSAVKVTAAVANFVNQHCKTSSIFWSDDITAARLLAPALHEVLSLEGRALPNDPEHPDYSGTAVREAFRRSLLIFLACLKAKFGAITFELSRHLQDFRQISQIPNVDWTIVPELGMWGHIIAALEEHSDQRSWHILAISSIMESAGLTSSDQVLDTVRGIIWVEDLFKDKVEALCHEIDDFMTLRTTHQLSTLSITSLDNAD